MGPALTHPVLCVLEKETQALEGLMLMSVGGCMMLLWKARCPPQGQPALPVYHGDPVLQ